MGKINVAELASTLKEYPQDKLVGISQTYAAS